MKDACYLIISKDGIQDMKKTDRGLGNLNRGETPFKLEVEVEDAKFTQPYPTKKIILEPWDKNLSIEDPNFESKFITAEEEEMIREHRVQEYKKVLEDHGYSVTKNGEENDQ